MARDEGGGMSGIISEVAAAAAGSLVTYLVTYLLSRRREKAERTPRLLFEFSDLPEHENLGVVGFRNLQSKLELLISGTIRNVGTALAIDIKLYIYHFRSSKAPPVHEISGIHVSEALQKGEAFAKAGTELETTFLFRQIQPLRDSVVDFPRPDSTAFFAYRIQQRIHEPQELGFIFGRRLNAGQFG
jgi:hypothetical protein